MTTHFGTLLLRRKGEWEMGHYDGLTPEERARITEIQDLLIERFVEQKTALEKGDNVRAKAIGQEIKALQREKQEIQEWATT
jgi:DNA-directed RNA polymerase subunit E'/Rpb7